MSESDPGEKTAKKSARVWEKPTGRFFANKERKCRPDGCVHARQGGSIEKKGFGEVGVPVQKLILVDKEANSKAEAEQGELKYSIWKGKNGNTYLYVWGLDIDEEHQNRPSVTRSFLKAFADILKTKKVDKVRWSSAGGEYLERLYGRHGFAKRIVDPNSSIPLRLLGSQVVGAMDKVKGVYRPEAYESNASDILTLAARYAK